MLIQNKELVTFSYFLVFSRLDFTAKD